MCRDWWNVIFCRILSGLHKNVFRGNIFCPKKVVCFLLLLHTVKPVFRDHSKRPNICLRSSTNYRLMQVKSVAEYSKWEHSAILSTCIKLPFIVFKIFVLSIFEWPFYCIFKCTLDYFWWWNQTIWTLRSYWSYGCSLMYVGPYYCNF